MRKALMTALVSMVMFSCGGGGGWGSLPVQNELQSPQENPQVSGDTPLTAENLTGYFEASKVKGLTVCAPATGECVQTNGEGKFEFKRTPFKEGEKVEFYAGRLFIGDVEVRKNGERLNPILVAEGDAETGVELGALLHALAGDETGNAEVIDLSKVEVEVNLSESVEKLLKEGKSCLIKTGDGRFIKMEKTKVEVCRDEDCTEGEEVKWGKDWLVIYYGAGDNDLSSYIEADEGTLKVPENADLVIFNDSRDGTYSILEYDHKSGSLVEVERGEEEVNSASGKTLEKVLADAIKRHPAEHYFLIISSHGDGVRALPVRFVAYDSNPEGTLFNYEFSKALKGLTENGFPKFNLIGFDECMAGSSELLYAVKDYVKDGVIASEYTEPAYGWDYSFLSVLSKNPSPEELAKAAVDAYGKYYSSMNLLLDRFSNITLAYYPVEFIKTYTEGVKEFSQAALNSSYLMSKVGEIRSTLIPVETYDDYSRVDAYDLWQKLYDTVNWKECTDRYCRKAKEALEKILSVKNLPYTYHHKGYSDGLGEGLPSIFFPYTDGYDFYFLTEEEGYYNPFVQTYWPILVLKMLTEGVINAPQYNKSIR